MAHPYQLPLQWLPGLQNMLLKQESRPARLAQLSDHSVHHLGREDRQFAIPEPDCSEGLANSCYLFGLKGEVAVGHSDLDLLKIIPVRVFENAAGSVITSGCRLK